MKYRKISKKVILNRSLKVDSIGELTVWHGNEFQTLTTRFVK